MLDASAPVLRLPYAASVPLHPPDAVQDVASVELQVNMEAAPLVTVVGVALMDTVGCGALEGVTPTPPPPQDANAAGASQAAR